MNADRSTASHASDSHAPDPEFAAHLEWQLRSALRREERFAEPVGRARTPWRLAGLALMVLAGVASGAGGVLAAQEYRRSRAAELLSVQYQVRFEIARLRADAAQVEVVELSKGVERGVVSTQEFYAVEERRIALAQESSVLGLDAIEVGHTGAEPDRRLCAELVDGRDLVTDRFDQELTALEFRKSAADKRLEQLSLLHEKGFTAESEVAAARTLAEERAIEIDAVQRKRALRADFLEGRETAGRVELLGLREDAVASRTVATLRVELATETARFVRALSQHGSISSREVRAAEHDLLASEAELRLATLEVETIDARLSELP